MKTRMIMIVIIALIVISLLWLRLLDGITHNLAAIKTSSALMADQQQLVSAQAALVALGEADCRNRWLRGLVADRLRQAAESGRIWGEWIRCTSDDLTMLRKAAPDNQALAELATRVQATNAEAWFWLAHIRAMTAPDDAIADYRRGLQLDSYDGLRWRELADLLLQRGDTSGAVEAYLNSCYNRDPGKNGCWGAGNVAFRLGDLNAAICYYRLSRWSGALDRANQLERELIARGQEWDAAHCPRRSQ